MSKSWLLSKTQIINAILIVATLIVTFAGYFPVDWAPYITVGLLVLNMILRFLTKGEISLSLPGSVPTIPPIFQAGLDAFEKILASLPPDLGPRAFQLIEIAAKGDLPDGASRLDFVLTSLQAEFPGVGSTVLRATVEQLLILKNQGATPKLSMTL